jgi:cyanophycinase-like exopeptidase
VTRPLIIPGTPTKGWIVLIGGGEFSFGDTDEIDRFLAGKVPDDNPRVAFLPTASGSPEYALHFGTYLKKIRPELETENVPVYRPRDARRAKNLRKISEAGLIYIGGGVTNRMVETMRLQPVVEALRDAVDRGAVLAAIGAGASALGVATRDIERPASALPGLGLLASVVVETGFTPADDTMLRRLMSMPEAELGLGIPSATAIAIAPDRHAEILGDGQIAVVRKPGSNP